jgi:hypothetical protein
MSTQLVASASSAEPSARRPRDRGKIIPHRRGQLRRTAQARRETSAPRRAALGAARFDLVVGEVMACWSGPQLRCFERGPQDDLGGGKGSLLPSFEPWPVTGTATRSGDIGRYAWLSSTVASVTMPPRACWVTTTRTDLAAVAR